MASGRMVVLAWVLLEATCIMTGGVKKAGRGLTNRLDRRIVSNRTLPRLKNRMHLASGSMYTSINKPRFGRLMGSDCMLMS